MNISRLFIPLLFLILYTSTANAYEPSKRILFINSYSPDFPTYVHVEKAKKEKGVLGITEFCSFKETIDLAQKLNPNLNELIVITDNTDTIPENTTLINQPSSTFQINKTVVYFLLISISILFIFILYMFYTMQNRKRMNYELMLAKEKAEEANRLKTAFITNMSHEIRTPMNSIVGFSSLLRSTDLNYETREQYCQIIEDNSNHLLALISDIIDISKIESGDFSFRLSKIYVLPLLKSMTMEFEQKIKKLNKDIVLELKPDIPENLHIVSDKVRITQLLTNLLSNAVKYTNEGKITLGCSTKNNELLVFVKDTGIGISGDNINKIFDRFVREEDAKKVYDGTGLGLAISKSIVKKFNGKIWVESEKGKGTTFYFTHPL
jgi:signal transduction histidine kinase